MVYIIQLIKLQLADLLDLLFKFVTEKCLGNQPKLGNFLDTNKQTYTIAQGVGNNNSC